MDKGAAVADNLDISSGSLQWSLGFIRAVQDWEVGDITELYRALYALNLKAEQEDRLLWSHSGNENFSVRSFYKVMSTHSSIVFLRKSIWRCNVPLKIALFGWLAGLPWENVDN